MVRSVKNPVSHEIVIKKSRFIGIAVPLNEAADGPAMLEKIKARYPDASSHCYAWKYEGQSKVSDDGEPAKTAGMPILNVLEKQRLDHILMAVVRYFGGIKLGAGGLVRAFTQCTVETLNKAEIVTKQRTPCYELSFAYHHKRRLDSLLKNAGIACEVTGYDTNVHYRCFINDDSFVRMLKESFYTDFELTITGYEDRELKEGET